MAGTDLRRSDVAAGIVAASVVLGGSGAAVVSASAVDPTVGASRQSIVGAHEIAVAVRTTETPATAREVRGVRPDSVRERSTSADAGLTARPPDSSAAWGWGPAASAVPSRPDDAPPAVDRARTPRPRGGIRALPRIATPNAPGLLDVDADPPPLPPGFGPGGPGVAPGEGAPSASPDDPYAYADPKLERDGTDVADGLLGGAGAPGPGSAAARAVAAYRQRLQRWLSTHFYVTGTGLPPDELRALSIQATLVVDEDRTVLRYEVATAQNPAFDVAARRALDAAVGQQLPAPPLHYPGPLQRRISVKFVCTEATCD